MSKVRWPEVFKFLSGAALAGSLTNAYLYYYNISLPFLSYTISPDLIGLRSAVQFLAFILFFYLGYLKK